MLFEKQQFQHDCVANIVAVLSEVNFSHNDFNSLPGSLKKIARKNGYAQFFQTTNKPIHLDVLMETGTGKTFTYLKTIFELNKRFNQNKFIVVLPRTAIKLGVIQNIKLTKEYFYNEYGKHINYIDYPQDGLSIINQNFIESEDLSVLITTNSAFNSDKNNINQKTESLFCFGSTWQGIAHKKPIVIIDEPHLLRGTQTQKGLDKLQDSLFIRFGATYPKDEKDKKHHLSNVVYTLDSISAFNQYLVKRISVNTLFASSETSSLSVHNIKSRTSFDIFYNINEQLHKTTVFLGDDLGTKIKNDKYLGISVIKINKNKIFLSDQSALDAYSANYELSDDEITKMIKRTIELHFEKEQELFNQGIKTLSLFFIPKIDDFRGQNPRIKTIFEQEYKNIHAQYYRKSRGEYKQYLKQDYKDDKLQVCEGYFSGDRNGSTREDKEAQGVDIILNDKEKLLSFNTPLRFIFSVWALQEGWDNPNIFNICKLSSTNKEVSRRQQVGRGLRVAVNQSGKRFTYKYLGEKDSDFYAINTLDMVVSGKEQDFIHGIQNEINEASFTVVGDTLTLDILKSKKLSDIEISTIHATLFNHEVINSEGKIQSPILDFLNHNKDQFAFIDDTRYEAIKQIFSDSHQNVVCDGNKKGKQVDIRSEKFKEFKQLWETINKKSTIVYENIIQDDIITNIKNKFNKEKIAPAKFKITKAIYNSQTNQVKNISVTTMDSDGYFMEQSITDFMTHFAKQEKYPLRFVTKLFSELDLNKFKSNPAHSQTILKEIIKEIIHKTIIQNVSYQFNQTSIYSNELQDEKGKMKKQIASNLLGHFYSDDEAKEQFLYDTVVYDSKIEKECILNDPIKLDEQKITVFAKLPKINIPTPYKTYNPDFAYLIEKNNAKKLFLVVETKGYESEQDISDSEKQKIDYAKKFFKALQNELPDVNIHYKTRVNKQDLSVLLNNIDSLK